MSLLPDGLSALYAFLGGTAFRLIITTAIDRFTDWQEHKFELSRMFLQAEMEDKQVDRQIRMIQAQKDLGVKVIDVEKQYDNDNVDIKDFQLAVQNVSKPTGFKFLDFWNSLIRPLLATFCIVVWGLYLSHRGWVLNSWDLEIIGATLGIFIGSRIQSTGK